MGNSLVIILKLYFLFFICYPILLNDILDFMICLVTVDSIFTLDYANIVELKLWTFLEAYMVITRSPLPHNQGKLPLTLYGGNF